MFVSSFAANATISTAWPSLPRSLHTETANGGSKMFESLREDVSRHPDDFITFETQMAANRFMDEHGFEANRETEQRMVQRGILGYWRGKMVVVLPVLTSGSRRGL
jgi:hypothetical protein